MPHAVGPGLQFQTTTRRSDGKVLRLQTKPPARTRVARSQKQRQEPRERQGRQQD